MGRHPLSPTPTLATTGTGTARIGRGGTLTCVTIPPQPGPIAGLHDALTAALAKVALFGDLPGPLHTAACTDCDPAATAVTVDDLAAAVMNQTPVQFCRTSDDGSDSDAATL